MDNIPYGWRFVDVSTSTLDDEARREAMEDTTYTLVTPPSVAIMAWILCAAAAGVLGAGVGYIIICGW